MDISNLVSVMLNTRALRIMEEYKGKSDDRKADFHAGAWSTFTLISHALIQEGVGSPVPETLMRVLKQFDEFRKEEQ